MKESYTGAVVWLLVIVAIVFVLFSLQSQQRSSETYNGDIPEGPKKCLTDIMPNYDACLEHSVGVDRVYCSYDTAADAINCLSGYYPNTSARDVENMCLKKADDKNSQCLRKSAGFPRNDCSVFYEMDVDKCKRLYEALKAISKQKPEGFARMKIECERNATDTYNKCTRETSDFDKCESIYDAHMSLCYNIPD